jgi:hypothetical protein
MGASRSGRHSTVRLGRADASDGSPRGPRLRSRRSNPARPRSWRGRLAWAAALAVSSALVAAGLVGTFRPAGQKGRLDASSQSAGTEFGASVSGLTALASDTRNFGHMPIIRTSYRRVPPPSVWTGGPAGANKSAVIISFMAAPAAILSGKDNHALARFFDAAPTGHPIYYSYDSEPEAGVSAHRFTAAQYRRAWAHIARIASRAKNPYLKSTLILRASDAAAGSGRTWQDYLPGGNVISTLAWDAYPAGTLSGHDPKLTPPATFVAPAIAAAKSVGLPFGVAGFALATEKGRPRWLKKVADYLMSSGALFGLVSTVADVPATQLTDHASIVAWRKVVSASGTDGQLPVGSSSVAPAPTSPPTSAAPVTTPSPPSSAPVAPPSTGPTCTVSTADGSCGPYDNYTPIAETTSGTSVGQDVWNPISGWAQTLSVTDPGNWQVTANMPAGNTAVVSYPSLGANYGQVTNTSTPLSDYASMYSSFSENMNATGGTSAWAAYDIWLGQGNSSDATFEVMIQHDFANNGACTAVATASFGGSGGVPVQNWDLCQFGSELVWKLTGGNEQSGTVDILAMLNWLVTHGYLPQDTGLFSIGYGWEICSTGGQNETFQVSNFSITPTLASSASP